MTDTIFEGVVRHLTPSEGVSQKTGKPWKQLSVHVVNEEERHPTDIEAVLFGENAIARFPLDLGDKVRLYLDMHTREHNERRYNQISIWKVEILERGQAPAYMPQGSPAQQPPMNAGAPAPWGGGFPGGQPATPSPAAQPTQPQYAQPQPPIPGNRNPWE